MFVDRRGGVEALIRGSRGFSFAKWLSRKVGLGVPGRRFKLSDPPCVETVTKPSQVGGFGLPQRSFEMLILVLRLPRWSQDFGAQN